MTRADRLALLTTHVPDRPRRRPRRQVQMLVRKTR